MLRVLLLLLLLAAAAAAAAAAQFQLFAYRQLRKERRAERGVAQQTRDSHDPHSQKAPQRIARHQLWKVRLAVPGLWKVLLAVRGWQTPLSLPMPPLLPATALLAMVARLPRPLLVARTTLLLQPPKSQAHHPEQAAPPFLLPPSTVLLVMVLRLPRTLLATRMTSLQYLLEPPPYHSAQVAPLLLLQLPPIAWLVVVPMPTVTRETSLQHPPRSPPRRFAHPGASLLLVSPIAQLVVLPSPQMTPRSSLQYPPKLPPKLPPHHPVKTAKYLLLPSPMALLAKALVLARQLVVALRTLLQHS